MTPFKYNLEQPVHVATPSGQPRHAMPDHGIIIARSHPGNGSDPEYLIRTDYPHKHAAHYAWRTEKLLTLVRSN